MATKKCPKCGEENPAEAVMCWACYTPLAGGAAAVAGGGLVTPRGGAAAVTPAGTAAAEKEEKTPVDPKIFLVIGLLVVAMGIGAFTTGLVGGPGTPDPGPVPGDGGGDPPMDGGGGFVPPPQAPVQQPNFPTGGTTGGGTTGGIPVQAAAFRMIFPPDPNKPNGTMAIMAPSPTLTPQQARALARVARQQVAPGGRWTSMQILVFNEEGAGRIFQKYQARRRGAKLTSREYAELASQGVWNAVPVYYESQGRSERVYLPSASPNNWWTSIRR